MEENVKAKSLPGVYLDTKKTTGIAVIKLIEALAGCYALYYILTNAGALRDIIDRFYEGLVFSANKESAFYSVYKILADSVQIFLAFEVGLIIIDGFAGFFTRVAHKGAGLVRLCHLVRYIFSIVGFLASFVAIFQYVKAMIDAAKDAKKVGFADIFTFLGSYELLLYIIVILGAFWIFLEYDRYVASVMKQVSKEIKAGEILPYPPDKRKRLGREALYLGGILGASAVLSIIEIVGGDSTLATVAGIIKPVEILYRGSSIISIAVVAVMAVKYILVSFSSSDFDSAHLGVIDSSVTYKKKHFKVKPAYIVILCLIIAGVAFFAYNSRKNDPSNAVEPKASSFKYTELSDGTISITEYNGSEKNILIPEKINGKTVSTIGRNCFTLDDHVTGIVLPETVTKIESSAFSSAQKLDSVTIKAKKITIGSSAFSGANMKNINFEGEDIYIESRAFTLCTKLKDLNISNARSVVIEGDAFSSATGMKSVTIVSDKISIGNSAFSGCGDLETVDLRGSDVSIGDKAFILCIELNTFTVDDKDEKTPLQSVSVGDSCFSSCDLTTFRITGGKVTMGDDVFNNNGKLKEIHVPPQTVYGKDIFKLCWSYPVVIYDE